jgi:hypothetical protein
MSDDETRSITSHLSDVASSMMGGIKSATFAISEAIDEGKMPGNPLDLRSKMTREVPLGMLLAAFVAGRVLARR